MSASSATQPYQPGEKQVYQFKLTNRKQTSVTITNYGAIISSFKVRQPDGSFNNIVLGFDKPEDYSSPDYLANYPFFGAAVGRYGNRIKNGRITIDNKEYQLSKNKGPDHLHGGKEGFDKKLWDVVTLNEEKNILELHLTSPDGDENYPGNLSVNIKFELNDKDEFSYEYTATTDKPTAINLTHHSYFNLNNGVGDIRNHKVKIYSNDILEQDANLVVNGNLIPVASTKHDFREFHKINERLKEREGYDQTFVLNNPDNKMIVAAEAKSEQSKLRLEILTNQPIIHFYTGEGISPITGSGGKKYNAFSGFCLETQVHPNAINIPSFPNTILRPGETYKHKTIYRIHHD